MDGCMKLTHFASAGRRENALELDDKLPLMHFLTDRERDSEDAQIASELSLTVSDCKACNNFQANNIVTQCALRVCMLYCVAYFVWPHKSPIS